MYSPALQDLIQWTYECMVAMDELEHYGTPRHSGRYPWGSGDNPYQRQKSFYGAYQDLLKKGMKPTEIAKAFDMNTSQLRAKVSNTKIEMRAAERAELQRLVDKGMSLSSAAKQLDIPWSTAKNMLSDDYDRKQRITNACANTLKEQVEEKKYLDITSGIEHQLGVSSTKLNNTVALLKEQGYKVNYIKVEQMGTGKFTTMKVLTKEDVPYAEIAAHKDEIRPVSDIYTEDGGESWRKIEAPRPISVSEIEINYTKDGKGGVEKDGLIELRRGVDELSLGKASYAQVRIAVQQEGDDEHPNGTHYMKGMAVYSDDLPDGVNVRYNTNKAEGTPLFDNPDPMGETVFKKMKSDPENPFGATIKDQDDDLVKCQRHYIDKDGNEQQSAINVVNEEGNWGDWAKTLSSQMLSKQSPALAQRQLGLAYDQKEEEFKEISELTNPTVKKHLLESFADDCEASAVHLAAAGLPGTAGKVILPLPDIPENQCYAPTYPDGTRLALIRYPHAGRFEIGEVTVNNKLAQGKAIMENAPDAIGIHPAVARKLSGADFDGDTVWAIPNNNREIRGKSDNEMSESMRKLRDFDPSSAYPGYPGMKVIKKATKQQEMGSVSNLITDMTLKGADDDEIARAVRYSMVVIDSEKHKLNYKQCFIDNDIAGLKAKYQGVAPNGQLRGASTIISRASGKKVVDERKEGQLIIDPETGKKSRLYFDPKTGEKLFEPTGRTLMKKLTEGRGKNKHDVLDENGKPIYVDSGKKATQNSTKMYEATDAYTLTSGGSKENPGTKMEAVYAEHANKLKALARKARVLMGQTLDIPYSPSARKAYDTEVKSLDAKLRKAEAAAPLERQAQLLAGKNVAARLADNPEIKDDYDALKKLRGQAIRNARKRLNSKKPHIDIEDREWEAIQSGAITKTKLKAILKNTDLDIIKQRSMPRTWKQMSPAKVSMAKSMLSNGHTQAQVAEALGVSVSTLMKAVD